MEFGIQFFPNVGPEEKTAADYYAECLRLCDFVDELGYTHVRTVEHYFHVYGGYSPNPIVFLTAVAQRTQKARLITGAVLPIFNHPLKIVGEIGMLDGLSDGRLEVGLARAFLPREFRAFGRTLGESVARFDEGVDQIRRLLEEENVTCNGQFHSFTDITSMPRPTQKPRPQFWTAAVGTPESFEKAGKRGDWLMAIPIAGGKMQEFLGIYRDAWKSAGHPGNGRVMLAFLCFAMRTGKKPSGSHASPWTAIFLPLSMRPVTGLRVKLLTIIKTTTRLSRSLNMKIWIVRSKKAPPGLEIGMT